MKMIFLLLYVVISITACKSERQALESIKAPSNGENGVNGRMNTNSLASLRRVEFRSPVSVVLRNLNGAIVNTVAEVKPNSLYKIQVNVEAADQLTLRACLGFDLVKEELVVKKGSRINKEFLIRTHSDVTEKLIVSFTPLHNDGGATLREQTRIFSIPN